jgi:hypothetical protein
MNVSKESIDTLRIVLDTLERDVSPVWVITSAEVLQTLARQLSTEAAVAADKAATVQPE